MLMPLATVAEAPARDDLHHLRTLLARASARARAGLLTDSLADVAEVHTRAASGLTDLEQATLLTTGIDVRLARGELELALSLGDELEPLLEVPGLAGALAHVGRGELAAATGAAELAAGHFARAGVLAADADDPERLPWRAAAALAAVRLGQRVEAAALAREHLVRARSAGSPYAVALGLRALATVDAHGDPTSLVREARATVQQIPAARLAAQLDTDLAGLLLLSGRPEAAGEALALLRGAETYAGREELWPLQGRIRRLLERLGEPARPVHGEALAALTAAERRVAGLAADGLTNREIAHQLVVTVKAVEWHLSHIYRKLGIRSRSSLATTLGLRP
jgi:ATP/maltotriose-dependent transcriptional regulator MalT